MAIYHGKQYDPDGICQDDYEWLTDTGPYADQAQLQTIGYTEPNAAERIDAFLAQQGMRGLIDIRYSPRCRWDARWNQRALQARYGRRYLWLQSLGNVNYNLPGKPIQLLNPEKDMTRILGSLLHGHAFLLLCACKDYARCHRKVAYELILKRWEQAERQREAEVQALEAQPRMAFRESTPDIMAGRLPDGRIICTTTLTFFEGMNTMPMGFLDNPNNWLSCVDGQTVWIEDGGSRSNEP